MSIKGYVCGLLTAAGIVLGAAPSQASIVDFNSHPADFGAPIFDSGFRFDINGGGGWGVFSGTDGACCNVNGNGTRSLFRDGGSPATITMTVNGGGTFGVTKLDASVYFTGAPNDTLVLTGAISGGGTVTQTLSTSTTWSTFALSGFQNLTSLVFADGTSGGFLSAPGFGVDNINIGSAAPEPATWAMLLLGFAGLAFAGHRAQRKAASLA